MEHVALCQGGRCRCQRMSWCSRYFLTLNPEPDCAGHPQHLPRDGGAGRGRRAHGEAAAQGRQRLPQVQGQAQQLAQGDPPSLLFPCVWRHRDLPARQVSQPHQWCGCPIPVGMRTLLVASCCPPGLMCAAAVVLQLACAAPRCCQGTPAGLPMGCWASSRAAIG